MVVKCVFVRIPSIDFGRGKASSERVVDEVGEVYKSPASTVRIEMSLYPESENRHSSKSKSRYLKKCTTTGTVQYTTTKMYILSLAVLDVAVGSTSI